METNNLYANNMNTTFYGRIMQDILAKDGFSSNIIENYNNEISNKIPKIITSSKIPVANGDVTFENVRYRKPYEKIGGKDERLTPMMSRHKATPYFARIIADMVFTPTPIGKNLRGEDIYNPGDKPEKKEDIEIGSIPAMLGSDLCWLTDKGLTKEEEKVLRMELGECCNDPLGYFIVKSERVIVIQENLRSSTFLLYPKDKSGPVEGTIVCPNSQGTTKVWINVTKHQCLRIILQHLKKPNYEGLPIFMLFKILGLTPEEAMERIYTFTKPEYRQKIYFQSLASLAEFAAIPVSTVEDCLEYVLTLRKKIDDKNIILLENILPNIHNDLFTNIPKVENKITHLAMYCAKMFEYTIGERTLDDRDSWSNKQLVTAGFQISKLFKTIWCDMINGYKRKTATLTGLKAVRDIYVSSKIGDNFVTAFGPNKWGLAKRKTGENITDSLKRATPIEVFAQITRVSFNVNRQSKALDLRLIHPSQLGYLCLYESPEGEGIGIVKNLATSCYISLDRDPEVIFHMLKDGALSLFVTENKESNIQVPLLVNGIIHAWCDPNVVMPELKRLRKEGVLHKDVCLFFNERDNTVEIYCDNGRPTRPLFVVDSDGQLLIEKKKLQNASVEVLVREGCIEYIDAREQEYIMVAQTYEHCKAAYAALVVDEKAPIYTHCEIDPSAILSICASLMPMCNKNAGPRINFQAGMFRQALGQYNSNEHNRFDAGYKMIHYPTKPLFQTDTQQMTGMNFMPTGQTAHVAILANPDNPEDGIILKEEAVRYGNLLDMCKKQTIQSIASTKNSKEYIEEFERPPMVPGEPQARYAALDEQGLPKLDAYIRQGDCIVGKVRKFVKDGELKNISEFTGIGGEGYVDRVLITMNAANQRVIRIKLRKNRKYIAGDKLACTTPDHKVMTKRGWIPITDIKIEDEVATLNQKQELEYQKPEAIHHYTYIGKMYSIKGQQIDQVVTPNHRMYIKKRDKTEFELDSVENIFGKRVNYKKNAINAKLDKDTYEIPQATYKFNGNDIFAPAKQVPMDDWLTFLGIWLGDGWVNDKRICIAANKPRVKEALDRISSPLGFEISKCKGDKWYIHDKQYGCALEELSLGASNKYIPEWCFDLSERQSKVFIEGFMLSDGHKTNKGSYQYYTSSSRLAGDIQRLALHAGWSANATIRSEAGSETTMKDGRVIKSNYDAYVVKINRTKNEPQMNHGHSKNQDGQEEKIIDYDGTVHCITVPNGIFYVQRNGIPSWTGNSRYSQKGTVARVIPARDLPRVKDGPNKGMVPDIIINPHSLPSRMTNNKIIEIKVSKAAAITGHFFNATTFRNFEDEMRYAEKTLSDYGLDMHGKENFILPNGNDLRMKIFFGPCHYQALRHHVSDKIQMRARGGVKPETRQPVAGRNREGGLKVGEMERDALISHGSSALLRERLCDESDAYNLPICGTCGNIAITDHINGVYTCKVCNDKAKFGIIRIPYAIKLLLYYLNAAGVHMTFKTENMLGNIKRPEEAYLY